MTRLDDMYQIFNQYQRRAKAAQGVQRYETDDLIRGWMPQYNLGFVMYSALTLENADRAINNQITFFKDQGADEFEWKYYDYDTPEDLPERLMKFGLVPDSVESVMILDIARAPSQLLLPVSHDIRRIDELSQVQDADRIHNTAHHSTGQPVTERCAMMWENDSESLSIYIAYVDDRPVSYGRVEFMPTGNPFASIWGGVTLPEYRRRGIYSQLVASRVQEARLRGYRYLTVDANPNTSGPILQKLGFEHFAYTTPYIWTNPDRA